MFNHTSQPATTLRRRLARVHDDAGMSLVTAVASVAAVAVIGASGAIAVGNIINTSGQAMVMAQRDSYATTYLAEAVSGSIPLTRASETTTMVEIGPGAKVPVSTMTNIDNTNTATVYVSVPRHAGVPDGRCKLSAAATAPAGDCIVRSAVDRPDVTMRVPFFSIGTYAAGTDSYVPTAIAKDASFMSYIAQSPAQLRYTFHVSNVTEAGWVIITRRNNTLTYPPKAGPEVEYLKIRIDPTVDTDFYGDVPVTGSSSTFQTVKIKLSGTAASISGALLYKADR